MGLRNPYSLVVDMQRGWVGWGDIGPDDGMPDSEEWNLLTKPGNAGWPYFVDSNRAWRPALGKVASAPTNNSPNNTGLNTLPPALPATIGYPQSCAVAGPVYYYNGANGSKIKLPPHLNRKWLVTDWWKGNLEVVTMSEDGASVSSRQVLMQPNTFNGPLDLQVGPDGALYVAEYGQVSGGLWFSSTGNTAISRLEYKGDCHPFTPVPGVVSTFDRLDAGRGVAHGAGNGAWVADLSPGHRRDVGLPAGVKGFRLYDIRGRRAWEYRVNGLETGRVAIPDDIRSGSVLRIQFMR